MKRLTLAAILLTPLMPSGAAAQDVVEAGELKLQGWNYDAIYEGDAWSLGDLFGAEVSGSTGEVIGDVEDLVLNDDGKIVAMIAEVGGFWDIGDTHVSVPWEAVDFSVDGMISVPVTEESIQDYDLFATSGLPVPNVEGGIVEGVDDRELSSDVWRASELLGDYVRVQDEDSLWRNFGYVSDLLVDDGKIVATLVNMTAGRRPVSYAYPYRAPARGRMPEGAWTPTSTTYDLPVLVGDATGFPEFEKDRMNAK